MYGCIDFVHPGGIPRWWVSPNALQGRGSRSSRGGGSHGVGWDPPVGAGPPMHYSQSGTWSAGQEKIRGTSTKLQREHKNKPCMAINVAVQKVGGFLPDILLLTQVPVFVWFDDTIIVYYYYS